MCLHIQIVRNSLDGWRGRVIQPNTEYNVIFIYFISILFIFLF